MSRSAVSAEDVERELSSLPVRPHYAAQAPDLPLGLLDDRQFELLAQQLLVAEQITTNQYDYVALMPNSADEGRDVVLYRQRQSVGVVQSKRYIRSIGLQEILSEICKFILFSLRDQTFIPNPDDFSYELWSVREVGEAARRFFDEREAIQVSVDSLIPGIVSMLRNRFRTLRTPANGITKQEEDQHVLDILNRLTVRRVSGIEIARRLQSCPIVRRWFFRGPDDTPETATASEIGCLMAEIHREMLHSFERTGKVGENPYLPSAIVSEHFTEFLSSGARVAVIVGGAGYGKSTWAAHMLASPPDGMPIHVIRGDDLSSRDETVAATIARNLLARRLGGVSSRDMIDAVWRWLDSANRLIVIDGLDRAPADAKSVLATWLNRTIRLTAGVPVRFVVTTRPETWSSLAPHLDEVLPAFYDAAPSSETQRVSAEVPRPIGMPLLSEDEARLLYSAFDLRFPVHGQRFLRTPSLISHYARLQKRLSGPSSVSRHEIFAARVKEACDDVERAGQFGKLRTSIALQHIGRLLSESPDGRISLAAIASLGEVDVIDAFIRADLLTLVDGKIRPESDEVAEYLWGSELKLDDTLNQLRSGRKDPLFTGAIAMAVAKLEQSDFEALISFLDRLLAEARGGQEGAFEAAAHASATLVRHDRVLSQLEALLDLWNKPNFLLLASGLGDLITDLHLPPSARLRLLLRLSRGEDEDDWRTKYWFGDVAGRWITPLAAAATQAARDGGTAVMDQILDAAEKGNTTGAVARGLLYEAAMTAPFAALEATWTRPASIAQSMFDDLTGLFPVEAAEFLAQLVERKALAPDLVTEQLWQIAEKVHNSYFNERLDKDSRIRAIQAIDKVSERLLADVTDHSLRGKLIINRLRHKQIPRLQSELGELFDDLDPLDLWPAVTVATTHRMEMIRKIIDRAASSNPHSGGLSRLNAAAIPEPLWPELACMLSAGLDRHGNHLDEATAAALENILYAAKNRDNLSVFWPLAERLAQSCSARARKLLIYFAGSPIRDKRGDKGSRVQYRAALFSLLISHEDGPNLDLIVWKLFQSAHERRETALTHLVDLAARFGVDRVLKPAAFYSEIERDSTDLFQNLKDELARS